MMKKYTERHLNEVIRDNFEIELNMPTEYPAITARHTSEGGVRDRFFKAKAELPKEITVVRPFNTDAFEKTNENTVYVAENGNDGNNGDKESPLATVTAALGKLSGKKGGKIVLRGGSYNITEPIKIGAEHSGTASSPLIITHEKGEEVYISGSQELKASWFKPLTDEKMKARLKPEARDKVVVCDLKAHGITEFGRAGHQSSVLLINNLPQVIARYPNVGEKLIVMSDKIYDLGGCPRRTSDFTNYNPEDPWEIGITDPRCLEWEFTDDIWLFGALYAEWGRCHAPIGSFNKEKMSMRGKEAFFWGVKYEPNNDYYFYNVFEELDVPGEWFLDRESGLMYLIPPEGGISDSDDMRFVAKSCNIFECENAEYVLFDGLDAGRCAGGAFVVRDCKNVLVQRCHVVGTCSNEDGEPAVSIKGGFRNGCIATKIEHFTGRAARACGGDRRNFIPANNFIQNCVIINPHCRFGIDSSGCGNIISHNYVKDTTMGDGGQNEGIFEYNVVEGGDTETHDTGMIYVAGGGCSSCGNHYRYNYFFDFAEGDYGIYFDDLSRGMYAYGNIVVGNGETAPGEWHSGGRSFNVHNGCEHCFYENLSIDAGYFAFGGDITYYLYEVNWNDLFPGIASAAHEMYKPRYLERNPTYKDYCDEIFKYEEDKKAPDYKPHSSAAEERLRKPYANNYENNVIVRAARPFKLDNGEESATSLDTNFITNDDPGFVDFEHRDYRFRDDSPVFKAIPGFTPPPFEKMGPVDDE